MLAGVRGSLLKIWGSRRPATRCGMPPLLASLTVGTSAAPLGRRGHWSAAVQTSKAGTQGYCGKFCNGGLSNKPRISARIATTQRQDVYLSISHSKGNQMASQVAKPPYAPPPREPGFPPPARPPRPDMLSKATVLGCHSVGFEKLAVGIVPIAANPCVSY